MTGGPLFLLLTGDRQGIASGLSAFVSEGARGEALQWVELEGAAEDVLASARTGAQSAYHILFREKYLDRQIVVEFNSDVPGGQITGRSAELAFALAVARAIMPGAAWPALAATGVLGAGGAVEPVAGLAQKITAALAVLPAGGVCVYPGACALEIGAELHARAEGLGITLLPAFRLETLLSQLGVALSTTWLDQPFRGLEAFEYEHASIFFGREAETEALFGLLARQVATGRHAVLVTGPSGRGKSSLVLAGFMPALVRRGLPGHKARAYKFGVLRPRAIPPDPRPSREAEALKAAFFAIWSHGGEGGLGALPTQLPAGRLGAETSLRWLRASAPPDTQFILVLDQLEEWFEPRLQAETLRLAFEVFAALAAAGVWLVGTLTTQALPAFGESATLAQCFGIEGRLALEPVSAAGQLDAIIKAPTRAAGVTFEPGLEAEILTAASHGGPDVLPLLELLLTELYEHRDLAERCLRFAHYRAVGGLEGIVGARAERAFMACDSEAQAAVTELLWQFETAGDLALESYAPGHPVQRLVAAFRGQRLVVVERDAAGHGRVRAAHQALLFHWPRAV